MNPPPATRDPHPPGRTWLNRTVLGIGLASLCSDWSHEIATSVLAAFLATMGAAAAWLGFIEGVSDGLSSFAKMARNKELPMRIADSRRRLQARSAGGQT